MLSVLRLVYRHLINSASGDLVRQAAEKLLYSKAIRSNVLINHCILNWKPVRDLFYVGRVKKAVHSKLLRASVAILQSRLQSTIIILLYHCNSSGTVCGICPYTLKSLITWLLSQQRHSAPKPLNVFQSILQTLFLKSIMSKHCTEILIIKKMPFIYNYIHSPLFPPV